MSALRLPLTGREQLTKWNQIYTMNACQEKEIKTAPNVWNGKSETTLVFSLLDQVCPKVYCSDVDRAILGATIGG